MPDETPIIRLPKRVVRLHLPDPYTGFWVDAWINHPQSLTNDIRLGDPVRTPAAFDAMVVAHNLVDENGAPYPQAGNGALFDVIPQDVVSVILREVQSSYGKFLPRRT